ncbi:MAG: hypothetical protein SF339_03485 [Blastocatellia bacterium]|nr:hypothetical protein [Blastocatellia bacterium]
MRMGVHKQRQVEDLTEKGGGQDVARRAARDQGAVLEQGDAIGEFGCEIDFVCDDEASELFFAGQAPNECEQRDLVRDVRVGGRLIEQEKGSFLREGARENDALAFAARKLVEGASGELGGVGFDEGLMRDVDIVGGIEAEGAAVGESAGEDIFERGQGKAKFAGLGDECDAVGDLASGEVAKGAAVEKDLAVGGAKESLGEAEKRRFSSAVRSEQGEDFAGAQVEGDAMEHFLFIAEMDIAEFKHGAFA